MKTEASTSQGIITKEMEEEEKQLMEEGERKEKEMMDKVFLMKPSGEITLNC